MPERWHWLYSINPIVFPLEGFRWALLPGATPPNLTALAVNVVIVLVLLFSGSMFFSRVERLIVDHV